MEERVREIVRDELSKYFCNIQNNEEYDWEYVHDLEDEVAEYSHKVVELEKENNELKRKLNIIEATNTLTQYNQDNSFTREIFERATAPLNKGGFNG